MLEGGVLTFFKDSKTSAAGGLVRPVPEQGTLSDLFFWSGLGKAGLKDGYPSTKELYISGGGGGAMMADSLQYKPLQSLGA